LQAQKFPYPHLAGKTILYRYVLNWRPAFPKGYNSDQGTCFAMRVSKYHVLGIADLGRCSHLREELLSWFILADRWCSELPGDKQVQLDIAGSNTNEVNRENKLRKRAEIDW
jgi:hypothetical protein